MQIDVKRKGDVAVARICGELDHSTAKQVRDVLTGAINQGANRVILDMDELYFMDSSGIGVLLGRYNELKKRGGQLCVKNINNQIDKVFRVSGLYQVIVKID